MRLARDGFRQQRLAGTGRADEQRAFRKLRADIGVAAGVVQEIDNFRQRLFGLLLPCDVREGLARLIFRIDFRAGLAEAHGVRAHAAAHALGEHRKHQLPDPHKQQNRQNPGEDKVEQRGILRRDRRAEFDACVLQPLGERVVREDPRLIIDGVLPPLPRRP